MENNLAIIGAGQPPVIQNAIAVANQPLTFDFQKEKVITMDLATLKRTQREYSYGKPIGEIFHSDYIEKSLALCHQFGLNAHLEEIFAAHNNSKKYPGTSVIEELEIKHGKNAVEAHILRRVFATIRIDDGENEELTTTLVLTNHQDGVQAAIGPCVKACHNQCIMFAERKVSTYGKDKVSLAQLFNIMAGWLQNFKENQRLDRERIERLKSTALTRDQVFAFIGILSSIRAAHDSPDKDMRSLVGTYPLSSTQINRFTEVIVRNMLNNPDAAITGWELYNAATELYKPDLYEITGLLDQNWSMVEALDDFTKGIVFLDRAKSSHTVVDVDYIDVTNERVS